LLPKQLAECRPIKIYDNYVAGLEHYRFRTVQGKIGEGDPLIMKREPLNAHDSFAVELYWQEAKLGYLPAYENIVLAHMLDRGAELHAFASALDLKRPLSNALAVKVYANLLIPGKVLVEQWNKGRADDGVDIYRRDYLE